MKDWLKDMPTTALVIFTGCVLAFLTGLFFFVATLREKAIDDGNWSAWLMFVAAILGVGYGQFAKKRDTEDPKIIAATADASVRVIRATAAASPPLTGAQAIEAGRPPDEGEPTAVTITSGESHNEVR